MLTNPFAAGAYASWPASPPQRHSPVPDTASPVYPERAIRPLPKRRLRDRLSSEHADTVPFPPQAPSTSPIFGYTYAQNDQERPERRAPHAASGSGQPCDDCGQNHSSELGAESEEDEEDDGQRGMQFSPQSLQMTRRDGDYYGNGKAAMRADWDSKPAPPASTASSADGYESFENTNNKKKRKIPQSNTSSSGHGHQSTLSAEMANMGISHRDGESGAFEDGNTSHTAYTYGHQTVTSTPSGTSPVAVGRGKYGRSGRGSLDRKPLGASTNGLNSAAIGRARIDTSPKTGRSSCQFFSDPESAREALLKLSASQRPGEPGIISTAIANAAQQRSTTPTHGGESLLQQQASKSPPQKTDFTFTPDGGENRPVWPGGHPGARYDQAPLPPNQPRRGVGQGTQTSPNMNGAQQQPYTSHSQPQGQQPQAQAGAQAPPTKPKKPRDPERKYRNAARARRLQQEYTNFHHPPRREDIWICQFCEYEDFFGEQPRALIRKFEVKAMAEKKKAENKKRLLEKARMKGRKGKKGSSKAKNNANNHAQQQAPPVSSHQLYDPPVDDPLGEGEEEYYEDDESYEYGDDPALDPLPPVINSHTHAHSHHHHHPHPHPHPHPHTVVGTNGSYPGPGESRA
jgi:hypothetical protein